MAKPRSVLKNKFGKTNIYESLSPEAAEIVVVVPGYSEGPRHIRKLLGSVAARGMDALSFSQPRRRGNKEQDPVDRQAEILSAVLTHETGRDTKIHAVAHSLGGAAVLRVAKEQPEKFASITIMQPPGRLGRRQSFGELLTRV